MSTIFISHSSTDNNAAEELGQRLARQNHHSIFLDFDPEKGIVAGRSWERTLYRKLRSCRAMLAICTDDYLSSKWCFAELALARMEGKHIVALLVDGLSRDAKLPAILSEKQFIDLRSDVEGGYERLWRALRDLDLLGLPGEWNPEDPPYLGLNAYQEEHAPVFFGREDEIRAGGELLERGAPGLILVLGASGSGKSSLVRAGIVPRLRKDPARWLIVGPFRPGRDPFAELSQSLVESFRRYAPDVDGATSNQQRIRMRLDQGNLNLFSESSQSLVKADGEAADGRVRHLMDQIEAFQSNPPPATPDRLRNFLDWSLEDLRRIDGQCSDTPENQHITGQDSNPLVDLADQLLRVSGYRNARVLVIVDQFEELLGHENSQQPSHEFLRLVIRSVESENSPLLALGTMRSDFLGQFQRDPILRGMDFESLSLGPMAVDGMRRVIEQPAKLSWLEFDEGLVERLLDDTETADALPLLSFTLSVLWRDRQADRKLTIRAYEALGGLKGAVTREADAVLAGARREGKVKQLQTALLRMARLNEDGSYARQPVHWSNAHVRPAESILKKLVDRRLLITHGHDDARIVEVTHEALFRSWAPLRGWLESAKAELLLQQQLRRDAASWYEQGHDPDTLWRGARLIQAKENLATINQESSDETATRERAFIRAGLRRQRRRMVGLVASIATVVLILTGALFYALRQAEDARRERRTALDLARASRAGELLSTDSTKAVLMLREVQEPNSPFVARRITDALRAPLVYLEIEHETPTHHLQFSPDGRLLATLSDESASSQYLYQQSPKRARVWDVQNGVSITPSLVHNSEIRAVSFSRDSKLLVTLAGNFAYIRGVGTDKRSYVWKHQGQPITIDFDHGGEFALTADGNQIYTWDLASGQRITDKAWEIEENVSAVVIDPDGKTVLIGKQDGSVKAWDMQSAELWTSTPPDSDYKSAVRSFYFNRDGKQLKVGHHNGTIRVLAIKTGKQTIQFKARGSGIVFSPDGKLAVSIGVPMVDSKLPVWDTRSGKPYRPKRSHKDLQLDHGEIDVLDVIFYGGSLRFLTVTGHRGFSYWDPRSDNMLRVWDLASGNKQLEFQLGQEGELLAAAFSPSGKYLATSAGRRVSGGRAERLRAGGTVRLWNLEFSGERFSYRIAGSVRALSRDGRYLATVANKTVYVWSLDPTTSRPGKPLEHDSNVSAVSFNDDASLLVTKAGGRTHVWNRVSGELRYVQPERNADFRSEALFHEELSVLITRSKPYEVKIRDLRAGQVSLIGTVEHCAPLVSLGLSRKMTEALAVCHDSVRLWDLDRASSNEVFPIGDGQRAHGIEFSADGARVLTGAGDNVVKIWTIKSDAVPLALDQGQRIDDAIFDPSGKLVLIRSQELAVLWQATEGRKLRSLEHPEAIHHAKFSQDGRFVITLVDAGHDGDRSFVSVWDTESGRKRFEARLGAGSFRWSLGTSGRTLLLWNESQIQGWTLETGLTLFSEPLVLRKPLLRERASNIDFVRLSQDDGLLVTATSLEGVIWKIGGDRLRPILDEVTTLCLSPGFRQANLGESHTVAEAIHGQCVNR